MMNEYIYYSENSVGKVFCHYDRDEAFRWYSQNNGVKIYSKTKDLFPTINIIVDKPNVDVADIREDDTLSKISSKTREYIAKYDKENTKQIKLKLNVKSDKAILDMLDSVDNKQGYIKRLILEDIAKNRLI